MMEAEAATSPEKVGQDTMEEVEVGEDTAAQAAEIERIFEEKRLRLHELEAEVVEMRSTLAMKEAEIKQLKEDLGLTRVAQIKKTVEQSTAFQKTKELGDRVVNSETYKKTASAFSSAGQKTSEAFGRAGTSLRENETLQNMGTRLRSASTTVKEKVANAFGRSQSFSETAQNAEAQESNSFANTP